MPQAKKAAKKVTKQRSTKVAKKPASKVAKKVTGKRSKAASRPASGVKQAVGSGKLGSKAVEAKTGATAVKGRPVMANKPTSIDEYLSHVDGETRALLQSLRETILELVPDAEECISYSMPAFRWQGKVIGGFAATRDGASYYPFSGTTLATLGSALAGYSQTKSAVHFTRDSPLPRELVSALLEARKAETGH